MSLYNVFTHVLKAMISDRSMFTLSWQQACLFGITSYCSYIAAAYRMECMPRCYMSPLRFAVLANTCLFTLYTLIMVIIGIIIVNDRLSYRYIILIPIIDMYIIIAQASHNAIHCLWDCTCVCMYIRCVCVVIP